MNISFKTWGILASAPLLALACSGKELRDVGDTHTNSGGGPDTFLPNGGSGGSGQKPQQGKAGASAYQPLGAAGQATLPSVGGEGGEGGTSSPVGGEGGGGGLAGAGSDECPLGENYLKNGGFEALDQGFPFGWRRYGNPASRVSLETTVAVEGQRSVLLALPDSYEYWIEQRVTNGCVEAGDILRLTGYYRADRAKATIDLAVLGVADEPLYFDPPAKADEWLPFSVELAAPSKSFRVGLWTIGPEKEPPLQLWFDEVKLVRVP